MPDCNIRNIDANLLRRMKADAASNGTTLRDWCISAFNDLLGDAEAFKRAKLERDRDPTDPSFALEDFGHNIKSCRIYGCALCIALGKKF